MIKKSGSRSSLFLMEQLIVILVFAVCASVCVKIFVGSYMMAEDSNDLNNAVTIAESGAECFKSTGGDLDKTALILGGVHDGGGVTVYYDSNWRVCADGEATYILRLSLQNAEDGSAVPILCDVSVGKISDGEIFCLTAAAGRLSHE